MPSTRSTLQGMRRYLGQTTNKRLDSTVLNVAKKGRTRTRYTVPTYELVPARCLRVISGEGSSYG